MCAGDVATDDDRIARRPAVIFDFTVEQANSNWTLVAPDQRTFTPAYSGSVWIDHETGRVLRIERRTGPVPPDFPISKAELNLEYAYARIEQQSYLLPARAESLGCVAGGTCSRNVIEFRNYRKFTADSSIRF